MQHRLTRRWKLFSLLSDFFLLCFSMSNMFKEISRTSDGLDGRRGTVPELFHEVPQRQRTRLRTGGWCEHGGVKWTRIWATDWLKRDLLEPVERGIETISPSNFYPLTKNLYKKIARERTAGMINVFILIPNDLRGKVNDGRKKERVTTILLDFLINCNYFK